LDVKLAKYFIAAPPTHQVDKICINMGIKQDHGTSGLSQREWAKISEARKARVGPRKVMAALLSVIEMLVEEQVTLCCQ
jgi:hypothetical protein